MDTDTVKKMILYGSEKAGKTYRFNHEHNQTQLAQKWFQESEEGLILFLVFYTQACRWSRCVSCNLPSMVSEEHIPYSALMAQVDNLFADPEVLRRRKEIKKVILSNNGSVLDQDTFSSTALMYLIAQLNLNLPNLAVLSMESRPEYVETAELEFIARALAEGDTPTLLEIAIGFEAFDDHIRNDLFDKGLTLKTFEKLVRKIAPYGFHIKTYFMQKPVPGMNDDQAVKDIQQAIDYLSQVSQIHSVDINMHLNPTYVAKGTALEPAFAAGKYKPPDLKDVARAALHAKKESITVFIGLSDEGLAVPGGSFITSKSKSLVTLLEAFNKTQDFSILKSICF